MSDLEPAKDLRTVEEAQKGRYDAAYFSVYREDPKRAAMYKAELARIENLQPTGGRILDVGCGIGRFLSEFSPQRWDRYGVDISELAIREARAAGIKVNDFSRAYEYADGYFNVVVFRGSLQLIPTPFAVIETCIKLLAPGGYLAFLSTPNSNSPYYRRFKTLPFLTPHANFLIPSDVMMRNALQNFGLDVIDIVYPYLGGPYARPLRDHVMYALSFLGVKSKFPFWRSSMEIYARKPDESKR
jgi:2-polyprenyl-3-methyl-5-hydroxy-6-metoxy-1,4-benzoquinol methylase